MEGIIVVWIVVAIVAAIVASNKGRSGGGWFFLCLLLPLAILVLLALPTLKPSEPQPVRLIDAPGEATKTCPQCAETVKAAAKICRFCRYEFEDASAAAGSPWKVGATFVVGSRVTHKDFGEGEVIGILSRGSWGNELVKVKFDDGASYYQSPSDLTPL